MSTSRQTHLNQQEGRRSLLKRNRERLYTDYASPSEDKAALRSIAEQAHAEWLTRQTRTTNLSDHLRKKY
jgi:vancomycin resistance protein YoaR